jgi:hypothetical protein
MTTNQNLFTNPIFETDLTGWAGSEVGSGSNAPTVTLSSESIFGGKSALVTAGATSPVFGLLWSGNSFKIPVTEGSTYTFSAYVKVPKGQEQSTFGLRAYFYPNLANDTGVISADSEPVIIHPNAGWTRIALTFKVPTYGAGNTYKYFGAFVFNTATTLPSVGYNFLVDGFKFETGSTATEVGYDQGRKNKLVDYSLTPTHIDHLTGMKLKADIRLGDFVFNRIDGYGVVWVITGIRGWHGLPDIEMQDLPRGWGDGSFTSYGRYAARQITLEGSFLVQDPDTQVEPARARLMKAINLVKRDDWLILNEDIPKGLKVRLNGTPDIETVNSRGRTDFSISLVAADPIKYKWEDARGDGYALETISANDADYTKITNDGDTPVQVVLEMIGPTTGPVSIFNKTNENLLGVNSKINNYKTYTVSGVSLADNVASASVSVSSHGFSVNQTIDLLNIVDIYTIDSAAITDSSTVDLYLQQSHKFSVNQKVNILGLVGATGFNGVANGVYNIIQIFGNDTTKLSISVPGTLTVKAKTNVSASFARISVGADVSAITFDSANSVATMTTVDAHGFRVGDNFVLSNTSPVYDGTYTVTGLTSTTALEFAIYDSQTIRKVGYYLSSLSSATIYVLTSTPLDVIADDYITIEGVNEDFNGTFKVASVAGTSTSIGGSDYRAITFFKEMPNIVAQTSSTNGTVYISTIANRPTSPSFSGQAQFGNIFNGSYDISEIPTSTPEVFKFSKTHPYDIGYSTQELFSTASHYPLVRVYNEVLTVDTYNREVTLNGEVAGYRSRLDTVVDWVELEPGVNEVNFEDKNRIYASSVSYSKSPNLATVITNIPHGLVAGSIFSVEGLQSVDSTVFANASNLQVISVPNAQSVTYSPPGNVASAIGITPVNVGHIYEKSNAYLNVYYRSGWIG